MEDSAYSGRKESLTKGATSSSERIKQAALALLKESDPAVEIGERSLKGMQEKDVLSMVVQVDGDPGVGEAVFTQLSCGNCHNIHGEGPALAPDLAGRVKDLSMEELASALLNPDAKIVSNFESMEVVLKDGPVLHGHIESGSDESVSLLDTAGNWVELDREQISSEKAIAKSIMPGDLTHDLTIGEFASLLKYVKSLSEF